MSQEGFQSTFQSMFQSMLQSIAIPNKFVFDFLETTNQIRINVVKSSGIEEKELRGLAPFHTLEDILRALWVQEGKAPEYYPPYVCLATKDDDEQYTPVLGGWYPSGETTSKSIQLPNPFTLFEDNKVLGDFVMNEERVPISYVQRNRLTIEDVFGQTIPTFYCFTLQSVLTGYTGIRPIPDDKWYGQFYPYFPNVPSKGPYTMTDEEFRKSERDAKYIECKMKQIAFLNQLAGDAEFEMFTTTGVQNLSFRWKTPIEGFEGCEPLFYKVPVNGIRPFMRLLSPSSSSLTKLFQPDILRPPQVHDKLLLETWVSEQNPSDIDNFLFFKVFIREKEPGIPPLYGTFRIFDDGTADIHFLPPKHVHMLTFQRDLPPKKIGEFLERSLEELPFSMENLTFGRGTIHLTINMSLDVKKPTKQMIRERIELISSLFQETIPPSNEHPFFMLRYKGVSNFVREDRVATFLTHITSRLRGVESRLTESVAKEFELSETDARKRVATWLEEKNQLMVADNDSQDYITTNNTGTDIAIYAQHPYYTFRIYRLESLEDFRRIYTTLYLLFFMPDEYWKQSNNDLRKSCMLQESVEPHIVPTLRTGRGEETGEQEVQTREQKEQKEQKEQSREQPVEVLGVQEVGIEGADGEPLDEYMDFLLGQNNISRDAPDVIQDVQDVQAREEEPVPEIQANAQAEAGGAGGAGGPIQEAEEEVSPAKEAEGIAPIGTKKGRKLVRTSERDSDSHKDAPHKEEPHKEEPHKESEVVVAESYFLNRLKRLDPNLFVYKKVNPADKPYTTQCAANWDRQPAVLNEAQYQRMLDIYRDDDDYGIITFGSPNTDADVEAAKTKNEKLYVMRYGSDPHNLNYFLCAEFFCILDELPIKSIDWESNRDRNGKSKPRKTCPFCHNKKIIDKKNPKEGETVLQRMTKPGTDPKDQKVHRYIHFLSKSNHPRGYDLPCCFVKEDIIEWSNKKFDRIRRAFQSVPSVSVLDKRPSTREEAGQAEAAEAVNTVEAVNAVEAGSVEAGRVEAKVDEDMDVYTNIVLSKTEAIQKLSEDMKDYSGLHWTIGRETVVEIEKYPLRPGVVGLCGPGLDLYLGQESRNFMKKGFERTEKSGKMNADTVGFFRVGVLNTSKFIQRQSFFAAIAPMLHQNTVWEVKELMDRFINEKVFLHLNFGNLMLEFFNPGFPEPSDFELQQMSNKFIKSSLRDNKFELSRLYRSYRNFKDNYLGDPYTIKQARHFIHALAEPGLLTKNGITIIILQYTTSMNQDPMSAQVEVRCPLMGYDIERYSQNDIAFITYSPQDGIWEPLIYVNRPGAESIESEGLFLFNRHEFSTKASPYLQERLVEFTTKCRSSYRGAFTLQRGIDSRALLPVSRAISILRKRVIGTIRDSYNHLVAITISTNDKNPRTGKEVIVPVVDDGSIPFMEYDVFTHLNFQSVNMAYADDVFTTYNEYITPNLVSISPIYAIHSFIQVRGVIKGFRLEDNEQQTGRISLPCGDVRSGSEESLSSITDKEVQGFQFDYDIDKIVVEATDDMEFDTLTPKGFLVGRKEAEDIYQHVRLTFSHWLGGEAGPEFRRKLDELLMNRELPLYEKKHRLRIELQPTIESWLASDPDMITPSDVLLKEDCLEIKDEGKCGGYCTWKQEDDRCLLHVPETFQVSSTKRVVAKRFFALRLIEEILRLPTKRFELFNKKVSIIQVPTRDIHIGSQWILPENAPAWNELLAISDKSPEMAVAYEEFSRDPSKQTPYPAMKELPEPLMEFLKEFGKKSLTVLPLPLPPTERRNRVKRTEMLLHYLGMDHELEAHIFKTTAEKPLGDIFTETDIQNLTSFLKVPFVQIELHDTMNIIGFRRPSGGEGVQETLIVFLPDGLEGNPAILVDTYSGTHILAAGLFTTQFIEKIKPFKKHRIQRRTA